MKVLVADDDRISLRMLEGLLTQWGYQVVTAADGVEAWRVLQEDDAPKMAILDWTMPGLDGVEICRRLRQKQTPTPTYVSLLTARTTQLDLVAGLDAGANDYITKPFDENELRARLHVGRTVTELQTRVAKSHESLLTILNQLQLGVVLIDGDGIVEFVGARFRSLLGLTATDKLQGHWTDLCPFGESDKQSLQRMMNLPQGQRQKVSAHLEVTTGLRYWMDVEVRDDPRVGDGKILFMYDTTAVHDLRRQLEKQSSFFDLIGRSKPMQTVIENILNYAKVEVTILIEGETGTGKELVAQAIHSASKRKDKPFVAVNCAGLSESLLISQLFGHKRGAFTGAVSDQIGVFEAANGGTVFLDEIGDITPEVQQALLRVLQEGEITRLGESNPTKLDVRVIAASHKDLQQEVAQGRFRADLMYRIRIAVIALPALRDRRTDIPLLATAFLRAASKSFDKSVEGLSADAMDALMNHAWPGNVRELKNVIEVATLRCKTNILEPRDFPPECTSAVETTVVSGDPREGERARICEALRLTHGNKAAAARSLGMGRAKFYRRLVELNIDFRTEE